MTEQATKQPTPAKDEEALDKLINYCSRLNALEDLFEGFNENAFELTGGSMHGIALILGDIRKGLEDVHQELDPE